MMIPQFKAIRRVLDVARASLVTASLTGVMLSTAAPSAAQVAARLSAMPSSTAAKVALPGTVSRRPAMSEELGHLAGETQLTSMSLVLKPTAAQDADMTQLIADQQNPASAAYHHWLTPEQFGARFGIADGDLAILQSWLQTRGFTVESVAPSRNRIVFSGTASSVENAFGVSMQRFRRDGQQFFENSSAVMVPVSLSDIIEGVTGLSSYRLTVPLAKRATAAQTTVQPNYTSGSQHLLVPWDFRQIYGVNTLISSGSDGTGIKIGVIGQSAVDTTQIGYFQQLTGQTQKLPTLTLVPNTGVSNEVSGDEGESELDLEYASGSAPGASVNFIYTGCTKTSSGSCGNNGVFDALAYAITNNLAPILTLSYGGCEADLTSFATSTAGNNTPYESYLKQANTQGQTVLVASGDEGAAACDAGATEISVAKRGLTVSYPASSPYVTAVGGTQLNSDASTYWSSTNNSFGGSAVGYIPETSWNDSAARGTIAATGGGVSKLFSKPAWQGGTGVPADGKRDVPDVSFPSSVSEHAYHVCSADAVCTSSAFSSGVIGGTSVAAPNFAAMLAVLEQANGGGALGNVNPILYTLAQGTNSSTIFHDITTGNNIVTCAGGSTDCSSATANVNGTMGFSAGVGYDLVTGLGSVDAPSLRTALSTVTSKTPTLALLASSTSPGVGASVTFTLNVSGTGTTPTGSVQFAVDGTNVGAAVPLASGIATYTYGGFSPVGNHTVTATYTGDSNYNAGTATIRVTAVVYPAAISLSLSSTNTTLNTPVTFTANVSGSQGIPTGTVQFAVDGVNVGNSVALSSGVATLGYSGFATSGSHFVTATYNGTATYSTVTSSTLVVTVASSTATLTPTVALAVTPSSPVAGGTITFTATVAGTGATPTGTVVFLLNGANLARVVATSGSASTTTTLTAGTYTIAAVYAGDATYLPAQSASSSITVVAPTFTMAIAPTTLTVKSGSTGSETLTLTPPAGGSMQTVNLTYTVATVSGATFSGCLGATSSTVNLTGTTSMTVPITVYTTASSCSSTAVRPLPLTKQTKVSSASNDWSRSGFAVISVAGLLGCFLFRRRISPSLLMFVVLTSLTIGLAGCGGSSTPTTTATSGGTYTITLVGTSGTTTASTSFTLTVQ